jgi:peptide/nickel transport system permease protein
MAVTGMAAGARLHDSRRARIWDALGVVFRSRTAVVGLVLVLFWVVIAIAAPLVTRYNPILSDYKAMDRGPSAAHWLGTDHMGYDVWARVAYGARTILLLAPLSVAAAYLVGVVLGLLAGFYGKWVDELLMRLLDGLMAFPTILLYMIIISAVGPSQFNVVLAMTVGGAPGVARLVRAMTMDIRTREYVAAARLRGDTNLQIMFREILPNCRGPLIVDFLLRVGYAAFYIGTLGYLGLGLPPPTPDWGAWCKTVRNG